MGGIERNGCVKMFGGSRWCELGFRKFGSGAQPVLYAGGLVAFWKSQSSFGSRDLKLTGKAESCWRAYNSESGKVDSCVKWPEIKLMIKQWIKLIKHSNQVSRTLDEPGSRKSQHVYIQGMAFARMGCLYLCSSTGNQTKCLSTWRLSRFKQRLPTCSHAVIVIVYSSTLVTLVTISLPRFKSRYSSHSNCAHK